MMEVNRWVRLMSISAKYVELDLCMLKSISRRGAWVCVTTGWKRACGGIGVGWKKIWYQ
jgi:hypothetical protein